MGDLTKSGRLTFDERHVIRVVRTRNTLASCFTSRLKAFAGLSRQTDMMGKSAVPQNYPREEIIESQVTS